MTLPLAVAVSVAIVCASALVALRWLLAHNRKALEHRPLADLQAKLDELEAKMLAMAMRR